MIVLYTNIEFFYFTLQDKSARKHFINVSLPYDLDQLRIVYGNDHAQRSFKKSSYGTLGNKGQPIMVDGPSNANNATEKRPMENSTSNANEDLSNTTDPNGAGKKQVKASSSGGKRRKEDVAHEAVEKFVECMKWLGEAMITVRSQYHSQNFL